MLQNLHTALLLLKKICCFSASRMPAKPNELAMSFWKQLFIRNITCIFEHVKKQQGFNYLIQTFLSKMFFFFIFFHGYSQQIFLFPYCWADSNLNKPFIPSGFFLLAPRGLTALSHNLCSPFYFWDVLASCGAMCCIGWMSSLMLQAALSTLNVVLRSKRENSRAIHFGNQFHKKTAISV